MNGIPSRGLFWEKENHLQNAIFGGYVSSLEGRFDTLSSQRFINSSNSTFSQNISNIDPLDPGHQKTLPHQNHRCHACQLAISSGEYLEAPGPYKALQARSKTTGGTLARSKRRTCCRCEGKRITQLLPSLVSFG